MLKITELHAIKMLKDYPKTEKDMEVENIISDAVFNMDNFLFWIDSPSDINSKIDAPFYEVIKYLNRYTKDTFKKDGYCFYPEDDDNYNDMMNFHAVNEKTKEEVILYADEHYDETNKKRLPTQNLYEIAVDDLSGKLSLYRKRKYKNAFLKLVNENNEFFNVANFWVLEMVNLAIHPHTYWYFKVWDIHRIFCGHEKFRNIWVWDYLEKYEEPYFMYIDEDFSRVAVFNFKRPEYCVKGIFKKFGVKVKCIEPDEKFLKEMVDFFNATAERLPEVTAKGTYYDAYRKYVKTNWQQLIFEYNHNTAGWGWGENGFDVPPQQDTSRFAEAPALPFDLPIPDYTKLVKENI